jgi:small subunit ribosomal protein S14
LCHRCQFSGRSRGYYRDFGLSRHFLQKLAREGLLPGIRKSSW